MNKPDYDKFMGSNLLPQLKFCGEDVKVYSLSKILSPENAELDDHCRILDYNFIDAGPMFKLGKYSIITWQCVIEGRAKTLIGDRVFIGPGTKILTSTYEFNGYYTCELLPQDEVHKTRYGDITIDDDAYIGANSVIMPGVHIGRGALVGSNTFVNKDLEEWGIYVGSPCKRIGTRQQPTDERKAIVEAMDWSRHL